jgi:predicted PurR-regulated permease PerM
MTDLPENSPSPTLKFPNWLRNTLLFPLVFLNIWLLTISIDYLQPLLSIVLVSIILAIVLDFPIKFLQGQGMPRSLSLTLVLLLGIGLVTLLGLLIVPALIQQVRDFIDLLPQWVASADALFEWFDNSPLAPQLSQFGLNLDQIEAQALQQVTRALRTLGGSLLAVLAGSFSGGLTVFFVIILTIFLLTSGEAAWNGIIGWFSPWWRERLQSGIPTKLKRFIGGQVVIALSFSATLTVIFTVLKVPLGLLFGFLIGMASLFPFMGAVSQTAVSLFLMLQDLSTGVEVFAIAFILGQILDNAIVPKVMSGIVGVNPIWVIIAVFMGAKLGGLVGILIAVPVASIIKDVVDELLTQSRPDQGTNGEPLNTSPAAEVTPPQKLQF